jgi:hypothetical protein
VGPAWHHAVSALKGLARRLHFDEAAGPEQRRGTFTGAGYREAFERRLPLQGIAKYLENKLLTTGTGSRLPFESQHSDTQLKAD